MYTEQQIQDIIDKELLKLRVEYQVLRKAIESMQNPEFARDLAIKILHTRDVLKLDYKV